MSSILIILVAIDKIRLIRKIKQYVFLFGNYIFNFCVVFSILIPWLMEKIPILKVKRTVTMRFYSAANIIKSNDLTLFGASGIKTDFGFVEILYANGIIFFLIYIYLINKLFRYAKNEKLYVIICCLVCYSVYTLMESSGVSVLMNITLIWLTEILYIGNKEGRVLHEY